VLLVRSAHLWHDIVRSSGLRLDPRYRRSPSLSRLVLSWRDADDQDHLSPGQPQRARSGHSRPRRGCITSFFQSAQKFKSRYATFGFSDEANLDKDAMWPVALALKELTAAEEKRIGALVRKAVR
jgi:hypothetical protein